jgi:dethiobiotin synthetase
MAGVFVTAIGTDCGKTHVSAAIVRELVAQGRPALALKPLMSGFLPQALEASDAGRLLAAMGRRVDETNVADICWRSFTDWLAPNVAARRARILLDYAEMLSFLRTRIVAHQGDFLVEGAGGVMSPLTDTHTNLDLAADLGLPVMMLATNYLGAVSHTLTALEVLAARGLETQVIVVTETQPQASAATPLIEELQRWTRVPLLKAAFARSPEDDRVAALELAQRLFG